MRTELNLDDKAVAGAMRAAPGKSKTDIINEALREYARRRAVRDLLRFQGRVRWTGSLDELRKREPWRR